MKNGTEVSGMGELKITVFKNPLDNKEVFEVWQPSENISKVNIETEKRNALKPSDKDFFAFYNMTVFVNGLPHPIKISFSVDVDEGWCSIDSHAVNFSITEWNLKELVENPELLKEIYETVNEILNCFSDWLNEEYVEEGRVAQ